MYDADIKVKTLSVRILDMYESMTLRIITLLEGSVVQTVFFYSILHFARHLKSDQVYVRRLCKPCPPGEREV